MTEPTRPAADPFAPLAFRCGKTMRNRYMLAPLTNQQSHADGTLGEDEYRFLTMRAQGGFGAVMTCAASVLPEGVTFEGQLGIHDDAHLPGLRRLAAGIQAGGALALVQLHHGGMRASAALIGRAPMAPSYDERNGAVEMTADEVETARDAFIAAARRAHAAGWDGVEIHGAHGYLLAEFLSPEQNRREDDLGGTPAKRARLLDDVIDGVRAATGPEFLVGVRLSPERFGQRLEEIVALTERLLVDPRLDFVDLSLWDVDKEPVDPAFAGRKLASFFTDLPRDGVRLGAAGKIATPADVQALLAAGFDFALPGRAAILHHDLPEQHRTAADFTPRALPVPVETLHAEGLGPAFVEYMRRWDGFVA